MAGDQADFGLLFRGSPQPIYADVGNALLEGQRAGDAHRLSEQSLRAKTRENNAADAAGKAWDDAEKQSPGSGWEAARNAYGRHGDIDSALKGQNAHFERFDKVMKLNSTGADLMEAARTPQEIAQAHAALTGAGAKLPPLAADLSNAEQVRQHAITSGRTMNQQLERRKAEAQAKQLEEKTSTAPDNKPPDGYMWVDEADKAKGLKPIQGFVPKADPIQMALVKDDLKDKADQRKGDDKRVSDLREAADKGREMQASIDQLRGLRKGVTYEGGVMTGPRTWLGKNLPDFGGVGGIVGIPKQDEATKAESIDALATNFQLDLSSKLKGAISDKEQAMLKAAVPGMQMTDAGANAALDAAEAASQRAIERHKFYEQYRRTFKTLDGSDDAWDRFTRMAPILESDAKGNLVIHRENITAWRQMFQQPGQKPEVSQGGTQTSGGQQQNRPDPLGLFK